MLPRNGVSREQLAWFMRFSPCDYFGIDEEAKELGRENRIIRIDKIR
jgi:hypothetical protein